VLSFFYHLLTTTNVSLAPDYAPCWQMLADPKTPRRAADPDRSH
jgi:hypothetical protein